MISNGFRGTFGNDLEQVAQRPFQNIDDGIAGGGRSHAPARDLSRLLR